MSNWILTLIVAGLLGPMMVILGRLWERSRAAQIRVNELEAALKLTISRLELLQASIDRLEQTIRTQAAVLREIRDA